MLVGFSLLVTLLIALLAWKIYVGHQDERRSTTAQTQNFALAMSAHVASEIQVVDLSLLRSAEAIAGLHPASLANANRIRALLARYASASDDNFWIHFVDSSGVGVTASNNLPIEGVSYADRPYLKVHLGPREVGLFVGAPEFGRVSKRRLFFLSRRVMSPGGEFLGVVVAPVDAGVFAEVFKNALFQPSLSITLLHMSGRVIARAPLFERSFGADLSGSDLFRRSQRASSGSYVAQSLVDKQKRVFSFQTVGKLPLVVSVGVSTESWTSGIRNDLVVALVGLAVILMVLLFSGRFALRSFRRMARSDADQRVLNHELRATQSELARGKKRLRMIADSLPALVSYINAEERYVFHNSYYRHVPGIDLGSMLGRTIREVFGDEIYNSIKLEVAEVLSGKRVSFERVTGKQGSQRYLKYEYTPDFDVSGGVAGFYTMVTDLTEMKRVQERLSELARVDGLTGLPNRNQLHERLADALARGRRNSSEVACLYLDIDHFKAINDTLGHAGGDEVLRQFSARLKMSVRETDLVARLAGDEFVIVLEGLAHPRSAERAAAKIVDAMREPFAIFGDIRTVTTSVGVAIVSGLHDDVDSALKKADQALYCAKRAGRGGFKTHETTVLDSGPLT